MTDLAALVAVAEELGLEFSARLTGNGVWLFSAYRDPCIRFRAELLPDGIDYELEMDGFPYGPATLPNTLTALRKWAGGRS